MGSMKSQSLFEGIRMTLDEARALTAQSLRAYGERYKHWAIAFSGGKDSSATLTVVASLIAAGEIPAPESLTVLMSDTRMELPPLMASALGILAECDRRGFRTQIVMPEMDDRYFVYMFGRGVPPPKNRFRWCTPQLKVEPMLRALQSLRDEAGEKLLMLTGVRMGESAARDQRIVMSCSRDGAECGQGWFQETTPAAIADTLAPLLHWRVCHVWDWLSVFAPGEGFPTLAVADTYGGDEAKEYGKETEAFKAYSVGKLPKAHIQARAERYAVKIFLSHWHTVAYCEAHGKLPPKPYVLSILGHADMIQVPNWPFETVPVTATNG